jgi:DNA-directed RNA polymerase subunit beta
MNHSSIGTISNQNLEPTKKTYAKIPQILDVPNLIQLQMESFQWFVGDCLTSLFHEISPIQDFTGGRFELSFLNHEFQSPKYTEQECRLREITYEAPLYITTMLLIKETGEYKEQRLFMGNIPLMTSQGTFIINGAERVVVSQLVRSPGVYFTVEKDITTDRDMCFGKLIPYRGAWLEFETSNKDVLSVKVDRKRRASVTTLLKAIGIVDDSEIISLFEDIDTNLNHKYIATTL